MWLFAETGHVLASVPVAMHAVATLMATFGKSKAGRDEGEGHSCMCGLLDMEGSVGGRKQWLGGGCGNKGRR